MNKTSQACDDFVDDCFPDEARLFEISREQYLENDESQLIEEIMEEEGAPKTCLVSLMDEPKVA
tara:strand:+ start:692 stop:883 length:192 start_codon:yes stop_codon:yes gene_type:complete